MLAAKSTSSPFFTQQALRELARSHGPCLSMVLPPFLPGGVTASPGVYLKSELQKAGSELSSHGFPPAEITDLLGPLEEMAETPGFQEGTEWGRTVYRSLDRLETYRLTQPTESSLTIANCFSIRRMSVEARRPRQFCVLSVLKNGARLLRCSDASVETIPLTMGLPATIPEALGFDSPDPEKEEGYREEYYRLLDCELPRLIGSHNVPVILAGIDDQMAAYRSISHYGNLAKRGISGARLPEEAELILQKGYAILEEEDCLRQARIAREEMERASASRISTDARVLLEAAFAGRVAELYLDGNARLIDQFANGFYRTIGCEDLLNLAAVQTILYGGSVYEFPVTQMPTASIVAGTLRY